MEINKISVNGTSYDIHDVRVTSDMTSAATPSTNGSGGTAGLMSAADKEKLDGIAAGATASSGTVTSVKVGTTSYDPTNGVVSLPNYPTDTNTVPLGYCTTSGATQAKTATCTDYALLDKSYIMIIMKNANSYNGKITLNINSKGAKDIYINGTVSSSSNKTLPAGSYLVYYESNKYYFRTDGKITGSITGDAGSVSGAVTGIKVGSSGSTISPSNGVITIPAYETGAQVNVDPTYPNVSYRVGTSSGSSFTSLDATSYDIYVLTANGNVTNMYFSSNKAPSVGHSCHVIVKSDGTTERTVTLTSGAHNNINYICPTTDGISGSTVTSSTLTSCKYFEVDFLRVDSNTIYVRGV